VVVWAYEGSDEKDAKEEKELRMEVVYEKMNFYFNLNFNE
jgi:hypothetical protein